MDELLRQALFRATAALLNMERKMDTMIALLTEEEWHSQRTPAGVSTCHRTGWIPCTNMGMLSAGRWHTECDWPSPVVPPSKAGISALLTGVQIVHLSCSLLRYCRSASHNQTTPPTGGRRGSFP